MKRLARDRLVNEIGRFADLDSSVNVSANDADIVLSFRQRGDDIRLVVDDSGGRVIELRNGSETKYGSYRGLLSSSQFGDLKRLVGAQRAMFAREAPYITLTDRHLPIVGELLNADGVVQSNDQPLLSAVESWLGSPASPEEQVRALVIDGPAGIGKTHLIRRLVLDRILRFTAGSSPPILHVLSQGRKLTTLNDVIAGRLQALRLSLTFDQVPVLARHGLIQVALDGFDELADPNGYDTAWASLRDFVEEIGESGMIILAGRDTFIDARTVRNAMPRLDTPFTYSVHLRPLLNTEAKTWLRGLGWDDSRLDVLQSSGLLDRGSYALRPFFIGQIAAFGDDGDALGKFLQEPLRSLIDAILDREVKILQKDELLKGLSKLHGLLVRFYCEVARDMADAEVDSIDEGGLALIVELVFSSHVPSTTLAMLQKRAKAIVLLEQDTAPDRRRFPHTEIQDYFLALSYVELVRNGEIPKSLRRNILGVDFLETFHDVVRSVSRAELIDFLASARAMVKAGLHLDRSIKNVPALMFSALSDDVDVGSVGQIFVGLSLDEAIVRGSVGTAFVQGCDFVRFDARGSDASNIAWEASQITTLIADSRTRLSLSFPQPSVVAMEEGGRLRVYRSEREVAECMSLLRPRAHFDGGMLFRGRHRQLFDRVCRIIVRQHWIRLVEGDRAGELLETDEWKAIGAILTAHDLLSVRVAVDARGPRSDFVRVRRAGEFIDNGEKDELLEAVLSEISRLDRK